MTVVEKALSTMLEHYALNAGLFYGSAASLSLGAGLICAGVTFPHYDSADKLFETVEGLVYVLTNECDIDPHNVRNFNDAVLVCPVIKFEEWVGEFSAHKSEGELFGIIPDIAKNNIYRVFYIPPIPDHIDRIALPFGGLIFLNQITSTHITCFADIGVRRVCALSTYGAEWIDRKLQNHLFRPKSEMLPRLH